MKTLPSIVSILFHPILIPTYLLLTLLSSNIYFQYMSQAQKNYMLLVIITFSLVLPISIMLIFRILNIISTLQTTNTHERILPFVLTAISYTFSAYLLNYVHSIAFNFIRIFMSASAILIFACSLIYFRWKISAHLVGWGGLMSALYFYGINFLSDLSIILAITSLISGTTAFARLKLNQHNPTQIYTGFLFGSVGMFLLLHVFN